jgi:hypothetical protein
MIRVRTLVYLLLGGCLSGPVAGPTLCTTRVDCQALDDQRVEIVGIYTVWEPRCDISAEQSKPRMVKVRFDGATSGPFLERGHKRPVDEIAWFRGKRVRVIGTYLRDMRPKIEHTWRSSPDRASVTSSRSRSRSRTLVS